MNRTNTIAVMSGIVERSFQETRSLGGGATIHDMETAAWKAARQFGQLMIQAQADEAGNGYMGSRIPCECGAEMRYVDTRSRMVTTWCGQMTLRRAYYRNGASGGRCLRSSRSTGPALSRSGIEPAGCASTSRGADLGQHTA